MSIEEFLKIRNNNLLRDDFLINLARRNKKTIFEYSKKVAGSLATLDLIQNECTQYFMLGANRGIDQANITDDGRGKYNPINYCFRLGIYNIRDFLEKEFRLDRQHRVEFSSLEDHHLQVSKYETDILGSIFIDEIIERLKPLDRKILQLIMYGKTDNQVLIPVQRNNVISGNMIETVANTLGYSTNYIYSRIYVLREVFSTIPIHFQ